MRIIWADKFGGKYLGGSIWEGNFSAEVFVPKFFGELFGREYFGRSMWGAIFG